MIDVSPQNVAEPVDKFGNMHSQKKPTESPVHTSTDYGASQENNAPTDVYSENVASFQEISIDSSSKQIQPETSAKNPSIWSWLETDSCEETEGSTEESTEDSTDDSKERGHAIDSVEYTTYYDDDGSITHEWLHLEDYEKELTNELCVATLPDEEIKLDMDLDIPDDNSAVSSDENGQDEVISNTNKEFSKCTYHNEVIFSKDLKKELDVPLSPNMLCMQQQEENRLVKVEGKVCEPQDEKSHELNNEKIPITVVNPTKPLGNKKRKGVKERALKWIVKLLLFRRKTKKALKLGGGHTITRAEQLALHNFLNLNPSYERSKFDNDAVRKLIQAYPDFAKSRLKWGKTSGVYPIFMAVALGASRSVVELFYEANPEAIKEKTTSGWTPLHYACNYGASLDVVKFLIEKHPEALLEKDRNERIPLHYACYFNNRSSLIRSMVEQCPESLEVEDNRGNTALMHFKGCKGPSDVLDMLKEKNPNVIEHKHNVTPAEDEALIKASQIIATTPDAVLKRPSQSIAPAHRPRLQSFLNLNPSYERNRFDNDAVRKIIRSNPDAARTRLQWGKLPNVYPIFMAVSLGASLDVVELFYDAFPDAIKEKTDSGWTLLHYACNHGASAEVVRLLIEKYPEALKEKDDNGRIPLHYACYFDFPPSLIKLMVERYPESLKVNTKPVGLLC